MSDHGVAASPPLCGPPGGAAKASPAKPAAANAKGVRRSIAELRALPRPRNTAELEALSAWYFGKALHIAALRTYSVGGSYEVAERYNDYHGKGWLHSEHCIRGYDYSRDFWQHIFGPLSCGGIASRSYGQFKIEGGYREKLRLKNLEDSWRRKDAGRVRNSLARLAPNGGGGESAGIGRSRALTSGRVDAAGAASLAIAQPSGPIQPTEEQS